MPIGRRKEDNLPAGDSGTGSGDAEAVDKQRALRVNKIDGIAKEGFHVVNQRALRRGEVLFSSLTSYHTAGAERLIAAKDGAVLPDASLFALFELGNKGLPHAFKEGNVGVKQHVRAIIRDRAGRKFRHVNDGGGLKVYESLSLVARDIGRINYGDIAFTKLFHPLSAWSAVAQCTRLLGVTGKQSHEPYCGVIMVSSGRGARKPLPVRGQKAPARALGRSRYRPTPPACGPTPPRVPPVIARPRQR